MAEDTKTFKRDEPVAIKLVKMVRDRAIHPAPHRANVHPDEVDNYRVGGWITQDEMTAAVEATKKLAAEEAAAE